MSDCLVAREGYVEGLGIEGPVGLSRREEFSQVVADRIGKLDGGICGQQLGQPEHIIAMLFDVLTVDFFACLRASNQIEEGSGLKGNQQRFVDDSNAITLRLAACSAS